MQKTRVPLTSADELLLHQTSLPMSTCGPSDHRFFDRHWFEALHPDGEIALIAGIGAYKNMNVMDSFVTVQRHQKQYNARASRRLFPDLEQVSVGPVSIKVLDPFREALLTFAPGDHGISGELHWRSEMPPYAEAHHLNKLNGAVIQDSTRYDQVGHYSGWLELNGERFESDNWWGVRDHSWGVRSGVGGFEPARTDAGGVPAWIGGSAMLWMWSYLATDEFACMVQQQENGEGELLYMDGECHWPVGSGRDPVAVKSLEHEIRFIPGTRSYEELSYKITLADGMVLDVEAEPATRPWAYSGTGYDGGYDDRKGLGAERGPSLLEHDVYDLAHPEEVRDMAGNLIPPGHREQPVRLTVNGKPGFGHFPVISFGEIKRYGLK